MINSKNIGLEGFKLSKGVGYSKEIGIYYHILDSLILSEESIGIICENPNFNKKIFTEILSKGNFNHNHLVVYGEISKNRDDKDRIRPCDWKSISKEIVESNMHLPWDLIKLEKNRGIPLSIFENIKISHNTFNFISGCATISIDYVINRLDAPWNWEKLTTNESITLKDICDHLNLPWISIELREDITLEVLLKCTQLIKNKHNIYLKLSERDLRVVSDTCFRPKSKKDFHSLSRNPNLTWKLIKFFNRNIHLRESRNPFSKWDIKFLSRHHGVPFRVIKKYSFSEYPTSVNTSKRGQTCICWDPKNTMLNPNLKWKNIVKYRSKFGWSDDVIRHFSGNPNMTYEIFSSFNFWIRSQLLINKYEKDEKLIRIREQEREFIFKHYTTLITRGDMGLFSYLPQEILEIIFEYFKVTLKG